MAVKKQKKRMIAAANVIGRAYAWKKRNVASKNVRD